LRPDPLRLVVERGESAAAEVVLELVTNASA
jgi:hypothetical protein